VSAAVLLKTGSAGSVPAGVRVVHLMHENIGYHTTSGGSGSPFASPVPMQFPSSGNLLVAMIGGGNGPLQLTGMTDSSGNGWSEAGHYFGSNNTVQAYYAGSATPASNLTLSARFNAGNGDYTIFFYDVTGAAATPLDKFVSNGGTYLNTGNFTMPFTLTPVTANEIVFAEIIWDYNTGNGLVGGFNDTNIFDGENQDGPEPVDENNGWGHFVATSTSPVSFTWQVLVPGSDPIRAWAGMAVAFKSAP
jgi:hypothetical protein